jgi:hypothetical protein
MCVLIFSITFVWNISHSKKNWAIYDHKFLYIGLHVKCRLLLADFNKTWISFRKNTKIQNFMKICQWQPSCFDAEARTDWRTDVTKLIVAVHNFTNAPNNAQCYQLAITAGMLSLDVQLCPVLRFRSCRQAISAAYSHTVHIAYRRLGSVSSMQRLLTYLLTYLGDRWWWHSG